MDTQPLFLNLSLILSIRFFVIAPDENNSQLVKIKFTVRKIYCTKKLNIYQSGFTKVAALYFELLYFPMGALSTLHKYWLQVRFLCLKMKTT